MKRMLVAVLGATALIFSLAAAQPSAADGGHRHRHIELQDDCDPDTFNAELGDGACVGDGDTTFDELVESALEGDPDGHWRNHPDETHVRKGERLEITNTGGEFHTFTKVAEFGPGCVPFVNDLLGLEGPPAADCGVAFLDPQTALPAGESGTVSTHRMKRGTHKFMCMIHPWMHTTVKVRRR